MGKLPCANTEEYSATACNYYHEYVSKKILTMIYQGSLSVGIDDTQME